MCSYTYFNKLELKEKSMKQFLAIYLGGPNGANKSGWSALDEATRNDRIQKGMKEWGDWMERHAKRIVVTGGPLGKTKKTSTSGVADTKNEMTGYVVVEAASHDEAARLFENHPHFTIFPGESVEIMECLPIPTA
ncbi:MAG: YciI family protein [Amphiplicatus sp.]